MDSCLVPALNYCYSSRQKGRARVHTIYGVYSQAVRMEKFADRQTVVGWLLVYWI